MNRKIKLVAVDIDGTFVRSDYTYDVPRFQRIFERMKKAAGNVCLSNEEDGVLDTLERLFE